MSKIVETLRGDLATLVEAGAINKVTMREFDALCPPPVRNFSAADIRQLRAALNFSQPVFALHLHTSASTVPQVGTGRYAPHRPRTQTIECHCGQGAAGNSLSAGTLVMKKPGLGRVFLKGVTTNGGDLPRQSHRGDHDRWS